MPIGENLTFGIGSFAAFGLRTDWADPWVGRFISRDVNLKTASVVPAIAWQTDDGRLALGAGVEARHVISLTGGEENPQGTAANMARFILRRFGTPASPIIGGGNIGQLPPGSVVLLSAAAKLASGFGIPPALAAQPPFNQLPNAGRPLSDVDVLTPTELQQILARAQEYNQVITQAAQQRDIPVADIAGLFERFTSEGGYRVGPFVFTADYLTGGIFSFDGFHLTDIGYMLFANEYIRTINRAYGTRIPVAGLSQFFANNYQNVMTTTSGAPLYRGMEWIMRDEAAESILRYATPVQKRRLRGVRH